MDAGSLTLVGVSPLSQDKTCVSGLTCHIGEVFGFHLHTDDGFVVLDTCGGGAGTARAGSPARLPSAGRGALASDALANTDGGGTLTVWWGSTPVSAAGGVYRLCWCSGLDPAEPCDANGDFWTDLGSLTLVGVSPLSQHRTCVSGQVCALDGIVGQHLTDGDQMLIMDTCAAEGVPRVAAAGLSGDLTASGAVGTWTSAHTTAAGGVYRLCWCANTGPAACQTLGDFRTDTGALTLVGPSPLQQHRTCVSGHTCEVDGVVGVDISASDAFLVLDTCGVASASLGPGHSGLVSSVTSSGSQGS